MIKNKNRTCKIKSETLEQIFNILVKFLGEPPNNFKWNFSNDEDEPTSIDKLTPFLFKDMVMPGVDLNDFILLSNIPSDKYEFYKKYSIKNSNNVLEGNKCEPINVPIKDIKLITKKSILNGLPVWFGADVNKDFHPLFSTLNTKLINNKLLLDKNKNIDKKDRFFITNQKTTHAMTFVGVNMDNKGNTTSWQVENSWGYFDNETPGLDGFLCMDDKWFDEYVGEVVVHKKFLTRKITKILSQNPIEIEPWESVAPALKVQGEKFFNMNYKLYKDINK
jgi:bleomycin hydrolase